VIARYVRRVVLIAALAVLAERVWLGVRASTTLKALGYDDVEMIGTTCRVGRARDKDGARVIAWACLLEETGLGKD
jgi:hypothetical protein